VSAEFDIAIIGASPLATLLAGILAERHRKRVVQVADFDAGFRLPRGIDVSVGPITRPETWETLIESRAETLRILSAFPDRPVLTGAPLAVLAQSPQSGIALAHLHQMLTAYGHIAERRADQTMRGAELLSIEDTSIVRRERIGPLLAKWAGDLGVSIQPGTVSRISKTDTGTLVELDESKLTVGLVVLVGPDGIVGLDPLPAGLMIGTSAVVLGEAGSHAAALRISLDTGAIVHVDAQGAPLAIGHGTEEEARAAIANLLRLETPLSLAARRRITSVWSADAAPFIGRVDASGAFVVAGLGVTAAFWAPALARHLAGVGTQAEDAFFAARAPGRDRAVVRDIEVAA